MKPQSIVLKKPIQVIQLFRNINTYGKEEKSFDDRKEKIAWKPIQSTAGYVKDEVVHLPESIVEQPNFEHFDLLLIIDDNFHTSQNVVYTEKKNLCFRRNSQNKFDFLQLKLDDKIELYLKPGYFEVGDPPRSEFKVCELTKDKPISIKINGKRDASLTWRRERTFVEQEYIFHYLGDFKECVVVKEPFPTTVKTIPTIIKTIDLTKTLY
ncbi:hypothetical protein GM921_08275 [Pedobacter sp. LMG 31464]|uniref:Uncharacterized protein n=1 Tax=Pedobacter planticolens TaxID=2679964 RepID=A0A923DZI2_9SPHI|nr:hypothetical protein [Pedobacter planticolens]MBB2145475.1 hypothetical protein [Pedobacter planticolens]